MKSHPAMRIVFILPSVMLGPGDYGPTPIGKLVANVLTGKMKMVLDGSLSLVDARDVALAAINGIEKGQSGERYLVAGRNYAYEEIMQTLANVAGITAPSRRPSPIVLALVARIMEMMSSLTGKPPAISRHHLKRIKDNFWYDSGKAERELNARFRPLSETLADTTHWFRSHGYA
jgi:nucleoside-diphosphate-sugar epimerase